MRQEKQRAIIIAGPTCSGKSALALALAEKTDGTIINADSMQIYRDLRILTARPSPEEESRIPHRLYGILPAAEAGSVAWWREQALSALEETSKAGRLPILCGGTGLYLRALTSGLTAIPDPGEAARTEARTLAENIGAPALHARLAQVVPETAATLRPSDTQRVSRAWEVWRGTGRGLCQWRRDATLPPADYDFRVIRLSPDRAALRAAISDRFDIMMQQGAEEEVRILVQQSLSPALPAMRAHGVPELAAMLRGNITPEEARRKTILVTGQYTKRQATWFAHQPLASPSQTVIFETETRINKKFLESYMDKILSFVKTTVDAAAGEA